jgi:flagellar biosynthetic protein FliP
MNKTFIRHYLEMLLAMFVGMGVLAGGLAMAGVKIASVELALLWMAFTMSLPMVAWMRYRGHGWAPSGEMTASMFLPSLAAIVLLWVGLVEDRGALMGIQHIVMLPAMLGAMLLRRDEYSGHVHA